MGFMLDFYCLWISHAFCCTMVSIMNEFYRYCFTLLHIDILWLAIILLLGVPTYSLYWIYLETLLIYETHCWHEFIQVNILIRIYFRILVCEKNRILLKYKLISYHCYIKYCPYQPIISIACIIMIWKRNKYQAGSRMIQLIPLW